MKKAVPGTAFFAGWLTAGSAIDRIFDDWRACVIFVFAFIFLIAAAMVLAGGEEEKDGMDHSRDHRNCIRSGHGPSGHGRYRKADQEARRGA